MFGFSSRLDSDSQLGFW